MISKNLLRKHLKTINPITSDESKSHIKEIMEKSGKINLIVRSNIRKALKDKIDNVAEEVEEALNNKVHEMLDKAVERAKANQRRTIQARDL